MKDTEDIELVIKIPRYIYKKCQVYRLSDGEAEILEGAVLRGKPLPKGHRDLKDMGNLQYVFDLTREDPIYSGKDIEQAIKSMTTIIEAESEAHT